MKPSLLIRVDGGVVQRDQGLGLGQHLGGAANLGRDLIQAEAVLGLSATPTSPNYRRNNSDSGLLMINAVRLRNLYGIFAALAVVLAVMGIYGLMSLGG